MKRMFVQDRKFVKTIAIVSGQGDLRKANVTVNLALAMNRLGRKVMIMGTDPGLRDIEALLHISLKHHIQHLLDNEMSIKNILIECPSGIKVLSAGHGMQELTALNELQKLKLLEELDAVTGDIDVLLIDTASRESKNIAFFCSAAQELVIVTSPESASIGDAAAFITMLYSDHQEKHFHVLVNPAKNPRASLEAFRRLSLATEKCRSISLDDLGFLPDDEAVRAAAQAQQPFVELYPHCPASKSILKISEKLLSGDDRVKGTLQFCIGQLLSTSTGSLR
jgi:flagellar biosynthesis protein FlhG